MPGPLLALWWVPEGTIPTVQEGKDALEHLRVHGSTPSAFTFAKPQPIPNTASPVAIEI